MAKPKASKSTKKEVWDRWKGKCAFCGIDLPVEQHHIIALSEDPDLADDADNLILLCSNHHGLTQKKKPNGSSALSIEDVSDLKQSKFAQLEKYGFNFKVPQNFEVNLGGNSCVGCPYVLVVNNKPLIEIWPQKPAQYAEDVRVYVYMRFFDEDNNFIGGMFANHWAAISNEDWELKILEKSIEVSHRSKPLSVKFEVTGNVVHITGIFYFDGIKIEARKDKLVLPGNNTFIGNQVGGCEVAFNLQGQPKKVSIGICGRLRMQ